MNKINRVFDLKSSLDRFIVDEMNADDEEEIFKIQFG